MDHHPRSFEELIMSGIESSPFAGQQGELLRMLLAIEEAKETIRQFEAGDISITEAVRRLTTAGTGDAVGA
jgi:hypothetical protein